MCVCLLLDPGSLSTWPQTYYRSSWETIIRCPPTLSFTSHRASYMTPSAYARSAAVRVCAASVWVCVCVDKRYKLGLRTMEDGVAEVFILFLCFIMYHAVHIKPHPNLFEHQDYVMIRAQSYFSQMLHPTFIHSTHSMLIFIVYFCSKHTRSQHKRTSV